MSVEQSASEFDTIVISADFPGIPVGTVFAYWIEPDLLQQWWPPEADVNPMLGGEYHLRWPRMDWHLHGTYLAVEPGHRLAFDWAWDHDDLPVRQVDISFEPLAGDGTRLVLTQGTYGDSEREREDRQGHVDGWTTFLAQLQQVIAAPGDARTA